MNYGHQFIPVYLQQQVSQPNIHSLHARVDALETRLKEMQPGLTFHHNQNSRVSGTPTAIQQSCVGGFRRNDIIHKHMSLINHLIMYQDEKNDHKQFSDNPDVQVKYQEAYNQNILDLTEMILGFDKINVLWTRTFDYCKIQFQDDWHPMLRKCIISLREIQPLVGGSQKDNFDRNVGKIIELFEAALKYEYEYDPRIRFNEESR